MKWQKLVHNGPLFPKPYGYLNSTIKVGDKTFLPSEYQEEIISYFIPFLDKEILNNKTFIKNYFDYLKTTIPKDLVKYRFPEDWDFSDLIEKRENKEKPIPDTNLIEKHSQAILNGVSQPIASPFIEAPSLFIGRGKHPQTGAIKFRVRPEDVNINATNIVEPPKGTQWKSCRENKNSMELCSYKIKLSTGGELRKKILFAPSSIVKQESDIEKFESAKILISKWREIEKHIEENIESQDALVSWLIMNLGVRVGDEKDEEDSADTVGASTLRKENISIERDYLKLDFLGKDSVRFCEKIKAPKKVLEEFQEVLDKIEKKDILFPKVSSLTVKEFLNIERISAKTFRTAWASSILAEHLQKIGNMESRTEKEKVLLFNTANLEVAKKLNHQKDVGKKPKDNNKELQEKYKVKRELCKIYEEKTLGEIEKIKERIENLKNSKLKEKEKVVLRKSYRDRIKLLQERISKKKQSLKELRLQNEFKKKASNMALNTSKTAYCDPRIGISWCKDSKLAIEKIYSKTLQDRFSWALGVDKSYYKKHDLIIS